jgi:electron transport complex protein RnfG
MAFRCAPATVTLFTVVFTALMALHHLGRHQADRSTPAPQAEKLKLIGRSAAAGQLRQRPARRRGCASAPRRRARPADEDDPGIYRARKGGEPAALVFEPWRPTATRPHPPDRRGRRRRPRLGVRVVTHKETPGLGDYIDPKKDRNKDPALDPSSTPTGSASRR